MDNQHVLNEMNINRIPLLFLKEVTSYLNTLDSIKFFKAIETALINDEFYKYVFDQK